MKLFMCFGGAAAVVDDEAAAEAAAAARHRNQRGRSRSFRSKLLSGKKGSNKKSPLHESKMDADDVYGVFGPSMASSVASSALSSAASLDSGYSSSSSSSSSARSSTASSSPSVSGELFPAPAPAKWRTRNNKGSSPAAGAAAVVLCLLMVVFCGRIGATLLMSMALYLFPRRWPARTARGEDAVGSPECDAEEAMPRTPRRKMVMDQRFLVRNRKK